MDAAQKNLRVFYSIIATQTLSLLGSRLSGLAVGFEVFRRTGEATPLLLVSLFSMIPSIFAANIGGVLADRWDRRKLIIITDAGQALCSLFLLATFASGEFQLWHLYLSVILTQILSTIQGPATSASITMLVPETQRDRANAIMQMSGPAAGIIAPALSGVLYAAVGVVGTIMVDLLTFVVATSLFLFIDIPMPKKPESSTENQESVWASALIGFRFLWARRPLLVLISQFALVNFCIGGAAAMILPYLISRTGDEALAGVIISINSLGGLVGGIVLSVWGGTRPRIHTIMCGLIFAGLMLAALGISQTPPMLMLTVFWLMFPIAFVNAPMMSIMQAKTPPDMQGRVFAVMSQISLLLLPPAYLLYGYLADNVLEPAIGTPAWEPLAPLFGSTQGAGIGLIMTAAGLVMAVASLLAYALPMLRHMEANMPDYAAEAEKEPA